MTRILLLFTLALPLTACGDADGGGPIQAVVDPVPEMETPSIAEGPVAARVVDGVQTVDIEAGALGYAPRQVQLQAGIPARLVFTRTVDSECSSQVTIPAFDIAAIDLPMDEPVTIEFTPTGAVEVEFVCGMDMQRGTIAVVS